MEFKVGDMVMLKVSPWKGFVRFIKRGKLNPRYVGPFKVLAKLTLSLEGVLIDDPRSSLWKRTVEIMEQEESKIERSGYHWLVPGTIVEVLSSSGNVRLSFKKIYHILS
ncbi:hypothetical protein Tco_0494271 [Tanacetum coccineum]